MANNASAEKANRQSERRRLHNRYYARTTRNAIRAIRTTTDKQAAQAEAPAAQADAPAAQADAPAAQADAPADTPAE